MAKHVISTLSADTAYVDWVNNAGLNTIQKRVTVKGGAGVALQGGGQIVATPQGVRTEISDADAEFLLNHAHFKDHMKGGYVKIVNKAVDPDAGAKDMQSDDGSRPRNADDVKAAQKNTEDGTPPLQAVTNKGK